MRWRRAPASPYCSRARILLIRTSNRLSHERRPHGFLRSHLSDRRRLRIPMQERRHPGHKLQRSQLLRSAPDHRPASYGDVRGRNRMMRSVRVAIVILIGAALMGSMASASSRAQAPATLTFAQSAAVTALDPAGPPAFLPSPAMWEAAWLVYDGLVRLTDEVKIVPELATSWNVGQDGRTWTFNVRRGASFHDGTPVTAQAIAGDLAREASAATNQSYRSLWDPIASVSAPNASTVQIVTKQPYAALLNTLAHNTALIVSPAAVEKWGAEYRLHPVGSGPYQVDRWDVGAELEVRRNGQYWGGVPAFERIALRS